MAAAAPAVQTAEGQSLKAELIRGARVVDARVREGRFQTWLSLIAGLSAVPTGLEVAYEHWRGSYSRRVMYTPVISSIVLAVVGVFGFRRRSVARVPLRAVSALSLLNSAVGFYYHAKGVARKPGGWRIPVINMIMGPPIFAPLLFGIAGYLGLVASFLRDAGDEPSLTPPGPASRSHLFRGLIGNEAIALEQDLREGRFQKHFAVATLASAFFSGFEAWYSHYKNNFRYWVQWTPLAVAPALMVASGVSIRSRRAAHTLLPAVSTLAVIDGAVGFYYHARGVTRMPGGLKKPFYNIMYGPPIFAPLLFAAAGFLGIITSLLRRERAGAQ